MLNIKEFLSNNSFFKKFEVDNLFYVEYKCILDEKETSYWTPNNYFFYVLGGKKKFKTMNKEYLVKDGDSLFIKRGAYVAEKFFDEEFCALLIMIPDDFIKNIVLRLSENQQEPIKSRKSDSIIPIKIDDALNSYFRSVLSYFAKSSIPPKDLLKIKFEELIINILINQQNDPLKSYFFELNQSSKIRISDIMESNYTSNLSLEEFASLCGRSLSTFKRDFIKTYDTPPGKWLVKKRLAHGKLLLETTDLTINEVTFRSGFENTSHFIKVFKSHFGSSPLKYRNSVLQT